MKLGPIDKDFPVILAPMAGVTDMPFRLLCRRFGCDLTYTEMVSAKALSYNNGKTLTLLETCPEERPCIAQIFGSDPIVMADMAKHIEHTCKNEIGIIDINMGCPAPKIVNNGEGSALMRDENLASRIISSVSRAVNIPVTVKFRKGWDEAHVNALSFARMAEDSGASAVAVHGRTREQGYSGKADWDIIAKVKASLKIPVFGNGDIYSATDALTMRSETNCDGVLIARGAEGNPFIFREIIAAVKGIHCPPPDANERISVALEHAKIQYDYKGPRGIKEMRKHIAWYVKGLKGANKLRVKMNECITLEEIERMLTEYRQFVS